MATVEYKYKAFISYRREGIDAAAAEKLQRMLEQYIVPKDFRENHARKLGYIFRDKTHIDADPYLRGILYDALDSSEYLIVMCSGKIMDPEHPWVLEEIDHFLSMHPDARDKILTVLVADEPEEAIPKILYTEKTAPDGSVSRELPNYVDIRGKDPRQVLKHLRKQFFRIAATLLSCNADRLAMRDKIRSRTKIASWIGGVAAVLAVIAGILLWSNWQIEGKNWELDQKNEELIQQNEELLLRESELLTREAVELLQAGDRYGAIEKSLAALPAPGEERPFYTPAEQVLFFAIDPFRAENQNYVFRDTRMEQDTAIKDFCINADGKLLTTTDKFSTLTCFDTVTGEKCWSTQVCNQYAFEIPQVFYCEKWDCVLFFNKDVIAAVSQKNGELLWFMEPKYAASDMLLLREEDGVFAYVHEEHGDEQRSYILMLCSALTGEKVGEIRIADFQAGFLDMVCRFSDTDSGKHHTGTFSTDGRYIAGSYNTADKRIHYFLADTQTLTSREIRSDVTADIYDEVCKISFDKNDESLVVIRSNPWKAGQLIIERIRVHDGAVLWTQVVEGYGSDGVVCSRNNPLLFGVEHMLYYLSFTDGEIMNRLEMQDTIAALEIIEGSGFGFLLKNGQTDIGWISGAGIMTLQVLNDETIDLGSCGRGQLWNGGSIRLLLKDDSVNGFTMRGEDDGGGYAVMIPQEEDHCVVIQRPVQLTGLQKTEYKVGFLSESLLDFQFVSEDMLVLFNIDGQNKEERQYQTLLLDPVTLERKASYTTTDHYLSDNIEYLPDGKRFMEVGYSSITLHDLEKGTATELIEEFFLDHWMGETSQMSYVLDAGNCRLSESGDVISAAAAEHGIRIWHNGEHLKDTVYPGEIVGSDQWLSGVMLHMGANGMIMVSSMSKTGTRLFYTYDMNVDQWYQIYTDIPFEEKFELIFGETAPVFLLLDGMGVAHLYDISSQNLKLKFSTAAPLNALNGMEFCVNDTCVLFYTMDRDVSIFDITSGSLVYEERLPWKSQDPLRCYEDHQMGYLFFVSENANDMSYCLTTNTWYVLTDIPYMMLYNEHTSKLLQRKHYFLDDTTLLWSSSLLTTEELISAGNAILGN